MDIFLLNPTNFSVREIVDEYISFIWTERYSDMGDFQLVMYPPAEGSRLTNVLLPGYQVMHTQSTVPMVIETVLKSTDEQGATTLKITGRSLESLFEMRGVSPQWTYDGTVGGIINQLVKVICITGTDYSTNDIIPGLSATNLSSVTDTTSVVLKPQTLFKTIKELSDSSFEGFRIYKETDTTMVFTTFSGQERPGVVFNSELDTLIRPAYLQSIAPWRNIAYVQHKNGRAVVALSVAAGASAYVGRNRRVLVVDATDIDPAKYSAIQYNAMLAQRGRSALAGAQKVVTFDGEIPRESPFVFGRDYYLGDIVTLQGTGGSNNKARITEYIWASDAEGERSYPSFVTEV